MAQKIRAIHLEKFTLPVLQAKVPAGMSDEDKRQILNILDSIQAETGIVIDSNLVLETMELAGQGQEPYTAATDQLNKEILIVPILPL